MRPGFRDSATVRLTNILTVQKPGGRPRRYLRVKGQPLIPLPDLPVTDPAFVAAWAAAMQKAKGAAPARAGTIGHLVAAFLRSPGFLTKSPAYRDTIRRHLQAIERRAGTARAADLRARHITADLADLAPAVALSRFKAWRLLCAYGAAVNLMREDPTATVTRPRMPASEGHEPWTAAEVQAFRDRWPIGTTARALAEVLHWTGCRISDAVRIGPGMVGRNGVLSYRQAKTGGMAHCPWTCALPNYAARQALDRDLMHQALQATRGQMTFLATKDGRPRSAKAIGGDIRAAARAAGVHKSAHGLRKTRAIALAEGGATAHQIGAWLGHLSLSESELYARAYARIAAVIGTEQEGNNATLPVSGENRA